MQYECISNKVQTVVRYGKNERMSQFENTAQHNKTLIKVFKLNSLIYT